MRLIKEHNSIYNNMFIITSSLIICVGKHKQDDSTYWYFNNDGQTHRKYMFKIFNIHSYWL